MSNHTFDEYLQLLKDFREGMKVKAPTEQQIAEWQKEWAGWKNVRRQREVQYVRDHLIIANVAKGTSCGS